MRQPAQLVSILCKAVLTTLIVCLALAQLSMPALSIPKILKAGGGKGGERGARRAGGGGKGEGEGPQIEVRKTHSDRS